MSSSTAKKSNDAPNSPLPPPPPSHHHRHTSFSEPSARVSFNKTIKGQPWNGYERVVVLFLTWEDDDMQCVGTEVDRLRGLFESEFYFETECFEIPSNSHRWEIALHQRMADFCYEYDSPYNLTVIYYGGHAYQGEETRELKFAARFDDYDRGDSTTFLNMLQTVLRLSRSDRLVILDCCYAAQAFNRHYVGNRKFELLASSAHNLRSPAPHLPHSFTGVLCEALKSLVGKYPGGFDTSRLYRDIYHMIPTPEPPRSSIPKPLLFDNAQKHFGRISLRPQLGMKRPSRNPDARYLQVTFRLDEVPDIGVMNELALHLQFLPHVRSIEFNDLNAPKGEVSDFMRQVMQASKLKPLIRKRLQLRRLSALMEERGLDQSSLVPHRASPVYDWSNASCVSDPRPNDPQGSQDRRERSGTWPPTQKESSIVAPSSGNRPASANTTNRLPREHTRDTDTVVSNEIEPATSESHRKRQRTPTPSPDSPPAKTQKVNHLNFTHQQQSL